jgi:hypothetical protein
VTFCHKTTVCRPFWKHTTPTAPRNCNRGRRIRPTATRLEQPWNEDLTATRKRRPWIRLAATRILQPWTRHRCASEELVCHTVGHTPSYRGELRIRRSSKGLSVLHFDARNRILEEHSEVPDNVTLCH